MTSACLDYFIEKHHQVGLLSLVSAAIIKACISVTSFAMWFPISPKTSGGELQRNKDDIRCH